GADPAAVASFWREYEAGVRRHSAALLCVARLLTRVGRVQQVLAESRPDDGGLDRRYHALRREIMELDDRLNGDSSRQAAGEKVSATIAERLFAVSRGVERSTYGPTPTHRQSLAIANAELKALQPRIEGQQQRMSLLIQDLLAAGAPWFEGERLPALGD
ncbi:MAG: hypothetical protein ACI80N_001606, partial [Gammaproteobacteria bacterium]